MAKSSGVEEASRSSSNEEMRAALISAALEITRERIAEEGPDAAGLLPLSWLRAGDIAEEAGFNDNVFDELCSARITSDGKELNPFEAFLLDTFSETAIGTIPNLVVAAIADHPHNLEEALRLGFSSNQLISDEFFRYRMTLAVSAFTLASRPDYDRLLTEVEQLYPGLLYAYGLQLREPLSIRDLSLAIAQIIETPWVQQIYGFRNVNPMVPFRGSELGEMRDWSIVAIVMWAVIRTLTMPAPESAAIP